MKKKYKWNEVRSGTKITLEKDITLKSFNDETRDLKAGKYFITGFWVDMCGLGKKKDSLNDVCIKSTELLAFREISNAL